MSAGLRVGVIGGSISGCATAALLSSAGHEVTVFERSPGQLASRGAGIGTPSAVTRLMIERGLLDEGFPRCSVIRHINVCRGGAGERRGRWLGDASMADDTINWAHLYENLRRRVPDEMYRGGVSVLSIDAEAAGSVMLETDDGGAETFDLVVCADGYHSAGRQIVSPDSELKYRGLLGWRGIVAETDADVAQLEGAMVRVLYPAGHGIAYLIPGPDGAVSPGDRLAMWGFYLQVPPEHLDEMLVDADGRQWTASVPLGKVHPAVTATLRDQIGDLLPPAFADLIDQTGQSSLQAIYSTPVPAYHHNRLCLLGDAGAVLPPFTASGVLKAMTNATELADALAADEPLDQALSGWSDSQQRLAGPVWQRAEYIERHLVFDVPDLFSMSTTDANAWMRQAYATVPLTLPDD